MPLTLLVDRDADTRRVYAEYLRAAPSAVDEVEDGREALAMALTRGPDLIVTETQLPGMSGYELCSLLRRDTSTHDIPIVFVTADTLEAQIEHAHNVGADAVLTKPCLPETLGLEIRHLLSKSAELRERVRATRAKVRSQLARSNHLISKATEIHRRLTLSRAHVRLQTSMPALAPLSLVCPVCDAPLTYVESQIGGVNAQASEQWDYFECAAGCGTFQYRQRTRKLRKAN